MTAEPLPNHPWAHSDPFREFRLTDGVLRQVLPDVHRAEHIAVLCAFVNSTLDAGRVASLHASRMARKQTRSDVPVSVKKAEGERLHKLWKAKATRSQAAFAEALDYSPGYLPQFFSGMRPLTVEWAVAFAQELRCDVDDFSPRLAVEIAEESKRVRWPFRQLRPADLEGLTPGQMIEAEAKVLAYLADLRESTAEDGASSAKKSPAKLQAREALQRR